MVLAALAKAAVKKSVKAGTAKVARTPKKAAFGLTGDDAYNARRRYQRSAERYLKQAEQLSGEAAKRYRFLAENELKNALSTYDQSTTQKFNKVITRLGNELGVDLERERRRMQQMKEGTARQIRESAISEEVSSSRLKSSIVAADARREAEARQIINSKVGSRIIGGLVDVWKDAATVMVEENGILKSKVDNTKIIPELMKHFNVDNLADLIEKVEKITGEELYSDSDSETQYETVKIMLQKHAAKNEILK